MRGHIHLAKRPAAKDQWYYKNQIYLFRHLDVDDKYAILDETLLTITNPEETLVIPPEVNGHRIKRIANGLFVGKNVKTIIISEGITEIGAEAFAGTDNLEKLILPESLKVLGSESFDPKRGTNKFPPDI